MPLMMVPAGMGQWGAIVRALAPGDLDQLRRATSNVNDAVVKAYGIVLDVEKQLLDAPILQARSIARFGIPSITNLSAMMMSVPLAQMQVGLSIAVKRIALLDLCFTQMSGVFSQMADDLRGSDLDAEASVAQVTSEAMDRFHATVRGKIYARRADGGAKEKGEVTAFFNQALSARGLVRDRNMDDLRYFEALSEAIRNATGGDPSSSGMASAGMGDFGVSALIATIIIVAGAVAGLALIASIVSNMFAASNAAMDAIGEQQKRKTTREAAAIEEKKAIDAKVAAGEIPLETGEQMKADIDARVAAENQKDVDDTNKAVNKIAQKATELGPSLTSGLVVPLAIGAGILLIGIVVLPKLIGGK